MTDIVVIGNVGSVRLFPNENSQDVLKVDLACNRKQGDKEYTDWIRVKVWGDRGPKLAPHIRKGDKLYVRGRPEAKGFLRKDGTAAADLVLHAAEVLFLTARKDVPEDDSAEDA